MGKLGFKVPFRQVYCDTFRGWLAASFWCHVVLRFYPNAMDPGAAPPGAAWSYDVRPVPAHEGLPAVPN